MPHPHEGYPLGDITRPKEEALAVVESRERLWVELALRRQEGSGSIITPDTDEAVEPIPIPDLTGVERACRSLVIAKHYISKELTIEERAKNFLPAHNTFNDPFGRDFWMASAAKDMGIPVQIVTPAIDHAGEVAQYYVSIGAPQGLEAGIRKVFPYVGYTDRPKANPYMWYAFGVTPSIEKLVGDVGTVRTLENMPDDLDWERHQALKISGQLTYIAVTYMDLKESTGDNISPDDISNSFRADLQWFNDRLAGGYYPHSFEALLGLTHRAVEWSMRQDS